MAASRVWEEAPPRRALTARASHQEASPSLPPQTRGDHGREPRPRGGWARRAPRVAGSVPAACEQGCAPACCFGLLSTQCSRYIWRREAIKVTACPGPVPACQSPVPGGRRGPAVLEHTEPSRRPPSRGAWFVLLFLSSVFNTSRPKAGAPACGEQQQGCSVPRGRQAAALWPHDTGRDNVCPLLSANRRHRPVHVCLSCRKSEKQDALWSPGRRPYTVALLLPVTGGVVCLEVAVQCAMGTPPAPSVTEFAATAITPRWPSAVQRAHRGGV